MDPALIAGPPSPPPEGTWLGKDVESYYMPLRNATAEHLCRAVASDGKFRPGFVQQANAGNWTCHISGVMSPEVIDSFELLSDTARAAFAWTSVDNVASLPGNPVPLHTLGYTHYICSVAGGSVGWIDKNDPGSCW